MRKDLIRTKIKEIEESIHMVQEHLPLTFEEFDELGLVKDGIYKRIEFAIENVIDICSIINSDMKLGIPGNEEDIINNLQKNGILNSENAEMIRKMKGFRNFIVHRYGQLDDRMAFESILDGIPDFPGIIQDIWDFVAAQKDK